MAPRDSEVAVMGKIASRFSELEKLADEANTRTTQTFIVERLKALLERVEKKAQS